MIERYLVKTFDEAFSRWRESWTAPPAHVAEWLHRFYRDLHPSTSIKKVLWENTPVMTRRNRCFTSTQHSLSSVLASMSSNRHGEKKEEKFRQSKDCAWTYRLIETEFLLSTVQWVRTWSPSRGIFFPQTICDSRNSFVDVGNEIGKGQGSLASIMNVTCYAKKMRWLITIFELK